MAIFKKGQETKIDRVTIYRTLQTFVDKGIIHIIPTSDNSIRYALCKDECTEGHHHDHHIHFVCNKCNNTCCLDDVATPDIKLPKGYIAKRVKSWSKVFVRIARVNPPVPLKGVTWFKNLYRYKNGIQNQVPFRDSIKKQSSGVGTRSFLVKALISSYFVLRSLIVVCILEVSCAFIMLCQK